MRMFDLCVRACVRACVCVCVLRARCLCAVSHRVGHACDCEDMGIQAWGSEGWGHAGAMDDALADVAPSSP